MRSTQRTEQDAAVRALTPIVRNMVNSSARSQRDHRDADDLHQMAMIEILRTAPSYIPIMPAIPFIQLIVKRRVIRELTHRKTMKRSALLFRDINFHPDEHGDETFEEVLADDCERDAADIASTIDDARTLALVVRAQLSKTERVAWVMFEIAGATYADIQKATGKSEKQIDNSLQRARRKLAAWVRVERIRQSRAA